MEVDLGRRLRVLLSRSERAYRLARRGYAVGRFLRRRPHEPDFAAFRHFRDREGLFLDVGANIGQSALSFRIFKKRNAILSIEPNPYDEPDLRFVKRVVGNFDFLIAAAGDTDGVATLYTPTFNGVPITGEATLDRASGHDPGRVTDRMGTTAAGELGVVEQQVQVRRLDELGLEPAFVKIDVETAEAAVVRGLRETIRKHRPVLMIESTASFGEVWELLAGLGYEPFVYDPERDGFRRYDGETAQNLFYLARDDKDSVPLVGR